MFVLRGAQNKHLSAGLTAILGSSWEFLGSYGDHFGFILGASCGHRAAPGFSLTGSPGHTSPGDPVGERPGFILGASWVHLGFICLGPSWGHLRAVLGSTWANLRPTWGQLGANLKKKRLKTNNKKNCKLFWTILGSIWANLRPT